MDARGHALQMAKYTGWKCPTCSKGGWTHSTQVGGVWVPGENLTAIESPAGTGNWHAEHRTHPS